MRFNPSLRSLRFQLEVAVLVVAEDGVAQVREMDADLVRASGEELGFEEAELRPAMQAPEDGLRFQAFPRNAHLLPFRRRARGEWRAHALSSLRNRPATPAEVPLVDRAGRAACVKRDQGPPLLRDEEHSRGLAIEAMDELE
jgi:hypothetical protein